MNVSRYTEPQKTNKKPCSGWLIAMFQHLSSHNLGIKKSAMSPNMIDF